MTRERRSNLIVACVGAAFVGGLLTLSNIYTPTPDITTPEQDALMLSLKAETIRTEADLRNLEKLAYEYEIAYKHSYNGATSQRFKSLVEPIIIAAGDRREAIRAEEDVVAEAQRLFRSKLDDIDAAWCMTLGTSEEGVKLVEDNMEHISALRHTIDALVVRKQDLGAQAWSGPGGTLDEACLKEIGDVERDIEQCTLDIAEYEHRISLILLAYRLQRGEDLTLESPTEDCTCDCCPTIEE